MGFILSSSLFCAMTVLQLSLVIDGSEDCPAVSVIDSVIRPADWNVFIRRRETSSCGVCVCVCVWISGRQI